MKDDELLLDFLDAMPSSQVEAKNEPKEGAPLNGETLPNRDTALHAIESDTTIVNSNIHPKPSGKPAEEIKAEIDAELKKLNERKTKEGLTDTDLFIEYQKDEVLKVASLDLNNEEDYARLVNRLQQFTNIIFEAKARYAHGERKLREHHAKTGKSRYDKLAGKTNPLNGSLATLTDPATIDRNKKEAKTLKTKLSQLESTILGFLQLGQTDDEIIDTMVGGKRTLGQVTEALRNAKKAYSAD